MKPAVAVLSLAVALGSAPQASAEMPTDKDALAFAQTAALNQVVAKRCPGIVMNEKIVTIWAAALSMSGKIKQFEAITPDEARKMVDNLDKEYPQAGAETCRKVREMTVADPTGSGQRVPLFIEKK